MFKAAIERGESDARISYPEREQARSAASIFNFQLKRERPKALPLVLIIPCAATAAISGTSVTSGILATRASVTRSSVVP